MKMFSKFASFALVALALVAGTAPAHAVSCTVFEDVKYNLDTITTMGPATVQFAKGELLRLQPSQAARQKIDDAVKKLGPQPTLQQLSEAIKVAAPDIAEAGARCMK